jgi:hypothetical protein
MARTKIGKGKALSPKHLKTKLDSIDNTLDGLDGATLSLKFLSFTGRNGAGAITLTGAAVGDRVCGVNDTTNGGSDAALFESTVTVANQIQQSSATDQSAVKFTILLVKPVS